MATAIDLIYLGVTMKILISVTLALLSIFAFREFFMNSELEQQSTYKNGKENIIAVEADNEFTPAINIDEKTVANKSIIAKQNSNAKDYPDDISKTEFPATKQEKFEQYLSEVKENNFENISSFHDLVIYCNSIPKNDSELLEWEAKHASDDSVDLAFMRNEVDSCTGVEAYQYDALSLMYRRGHDLGSIHASFALAKLMPYESKEKIDLLSNSAALYPDAHTMLTNRAIDNSGLMSPQERYFWMMTHPQNQMFGNEFSNMLLDVEGLLSNTEMESVQQLINDWSEAGDADKSELIKNLLSLKKHQQKPVRQNS